MYFKNTSHGAFAGELRHGNTAGLCGNAMMGFDEVEEINTLLEELGVDAEDIHGHIAWAMDLYEHGIITKRDLGGIDLKWDDKQAVMAMLKKIVYKEDAAPAAIAEGYEHAIKVFGPESKRLAWYSPGNTSIPRYDPRHKVFGLALKYGMYHGGGDFFDAPTMCIFSAFPFFAIFGPPPEVCRTFLNAATDWDITPEKMGELMLRNEYITRCYSLREGFHPDKDAWLPERAFTEPVTNKYGEKWVWTKEEWADAMKHNYINNMKLSERGLPVKEIMKMLGLDFAISVLNSMDAVG
jgi:aldehyde:ferredoxin oxidoreductase